MRKITRKPHGMTRRLALGLGLSGSLAACATTDAASAYAGAVAFAHGIASGDPLSDRVILWTRVTPSAAGPVPVRWTVARDRALTQIVRSGTFETDASRDYTVKVDVDRLPAGTVLFYGFAVGAQASPVGRTKTAPKGKVDQARIAVCSCSNIPFGYFNAYDAMSKIEALDLVLHLGDYIYEYGREGYGGETGAKLGRQVEPPKEIVTLSDYRTRHAQYKADPALQAAHAAAPWMAVWDDHESANDSWAGGAQNHQPEAEGDWAARKAAALQAYFEWMPIRDMAPGRAREAIYRSVAWGDLIRIVMLETRLTARAQQLSFETDVAEGPAGFLSKLNDPDRQILGQGQEQWLSETFAASKDQAAWRLVGNQVILARMPAPDLTKLPAPILDQLAQRFPPLRAFAPLSALGVPWNLDAWDGYPAQRERVYEVARASGPTIVVTGDTHAAWANECRTQSGALAAIEFGTTSITSPSFGDIFLPFDVGALLTEASPEVLWTDQHRRGFLLVTFKPEEALAEFFAVSTILEPTYELARIKAYRTRRNGPDLSPLIEA